MLLGETERLGAVVSVALESEHDREAVGTLIYWHGNMSVMLTYFRDTINDTE